MKTGDTCKIAVVVLTVALCFTTIMFGIFVCTVSSRFEEAKKQIEHLEMKYASLSKTVSQVEHQSDSMGVYLIQQDELIREEIKDLHDYVSLRRW